MKTKAINTQEKEKEGKKKRRYSGKVEGKNGCKGRRKERGGRERG